MLAAGATGPGALSNRLAADVAFPPPGNRGSRRFRALERAIFLAGSPSARAASDLRRPSTAFTEQLRASLLTDL